MRDEVSRNGIARSESKSDSTRPADKTIFGFTNAAYVTGGLNSSTSE